MTVQLSNHIAADVASESSRIQYAIKAVLSGVRTAIPVKVTAVSNDGGVSPIGQVSVQPMIGSLDGNGTIWPHGVIQDVPYMRIQGGSNAVILDPQVGDIGIATVADRDISVVKNGNGDISGPGSNRKHDLSDMIYLMTIIGAAPSQYVQFNAAGITVLSPNSVTVQAPTATVNASTSAIVNAGTVTVTATGVATVKAASAVIQAATIALKNSGTALMALLNAAFATWATGHVHSNGNGGADTGTPTTTPGADTQTSVVTAE